MSKDEQVQVIGRLNIERAEVKRNAALTLARIQEAAKSLERAGAHLMRSFPTDSDLVDGLRFLDEALLFGDVQNLKGLVAEYRALQERIGAISTTLKLAGTE